jgi:hypothetical protein
MTSNQGETDNFSLSEGGPFYEMLKKMGLYNNQGKLALVGLIISWFPLLVITAFEGTLYSGIQMPFLKDVAMQARLLIAFPLLILIKSAIDSKVNAVTKYISDALMDQEERHLILNTAFQRAKKLTNSGLTELILLIIVIGATISFVKTGAFGSIKEGASSWMANNNTVNKDLSIAGYWAIFCSLPLFQFFLLRWVWRYLVWILLLFRLSKAKLNLLPTHADHSGGLGILILAQRNFNLIFVAGSVVISGQLMEQLIINPDTFLTIRNEVIGYIVISLVLIIFPMLFFAGKLVKTKQEGLINLGNLSATLSRRFENDWLNDIPIEKRISDQLVDPSMLYDYAGVYESLQQLRIVPINLRDVIGMAITLFLPFIPILFIHFSVAELLKKIIGLLV